MRLNANLCLLGFALLLSACSSKPLIAEYRPVEPSQDDWYPIPADAPTYVEFVESNVPQNEPFVPVSVQVAKETTLSVVELKDSLGNKSLRFNRTTVATWELVDLALEELEVELADKNRSEYRFDLDTEKKGGIWSSLVGIKAEQLSIVLIPQEQNTLLVVEGIGDEVPESPLADKILEDLFKHFHQDRPAKR